jgi:hypothetical protein
MKYCKTVGLFLILIIIVLVLLLTSVHTSVKNNPPLSTHAQIGTYDGISIPYNYWDKVIKVLQDSSATYKFLQSGTNEYDIYITAVDGDMVTLDIGGVTVIDENTSQFIRSEILRVNIKTGTVQRQELTGDMPWVPEPKEFKPTEKANAKK